MALSRKQRKQLKKLKISASDLWDEQRTVLTHAGGVFRETGRQLGNVSKDEVAPRVRSVVDDQIRPVVNSTYQAGRSIANDARRKVQKDVMPGLSAAVASALASLDVSDDPRVRDLVKKAQKASDKVGKNANTAFAQGSKTAKKAYDKYGSKVGLKKQKSGLGFGGWALISLGVVVVAGIAYAAWQTLRADDELWVLDETDDTDKPTS